MSSLFKPYRALGVYSGSYPGIVHWHKNRRYHILNVPISNAFHSYKVDGLGIIGISDSMPSEITQLSEYHSLVSAQADGHLWVFMNGKVLFKFKTADDIVAHYLFGMDVAVILTDSPSLMVVNFRDGEILTEIPLDSNRKYSHLLHPPTYENKVLVTNDFGEIELFNIKTGKKIYSFDALKGKNITTVLKTPHLHVIGVGLEDGTFSLLNIKKNKILLKLNNANRVTAADCRTDLPVAAIATDDGKISIWNLEHMQLITQIDNHESAVLSITYLPNEDCFVTVGSDNSIRVFAENKQLRYRFGHSLPPTKIQFYGSEEKHLILSAGLDRTMKVFSPEHESGNKNLGKCTLVHKSKKTEHAMSHIVDFATSKTRENAWDNLVAVHSDSNTATTWSTYKTKRGAFNFKPKNLKAKVTSVECSQCGNMAWIGCDDGSIREYNLQSGRMRKEYVIGDEKSNAHDDKITGMGCQMLQVALITTSLDGKLKAWRIHSGKLLETIDLHEPALNFSFQRKANLAAVALADFSIIIVDCTGHPLTLARSLSGHSAEIRDISWSQDTRWLATASSDSSIKVWDITTSSLIDQFRTPSIPTSVDFSPNDQFLATTHCDEIGVFLWSNIQAFDPRPVRVIDESEVPEMVSMLPQVKVTDELDFVGEDEIKDMDDEYKSPEVIDDCVTVTGLPNSRWISLVNLKLIKERNKVVDVKVPVKAPFFLPTVAGVSGVEFDRSALEEDGQSKIASNKKPMISLVSGTGRQMESYLSGSDLHVLMKMLEIFSPSKLDSEISALDPEGCCSEKPLEGFLSLLRDSLKKGLYWDLSQAMLRVCLAKHFEEILKYEGLFAILEECKTACKDGVSSLEKDVEDCLLFAQFLVNNTIAVQE